MFKKPKINRQSKIINFSEEDENDDQKKNLKNKTKNNNKTIY